MSLKANGGGDEPENVNQGLTDALEQSEWSSQSSNTARILFLVCDCPPHLEYKDTPSYTQTCKKAVSQGIIITVFCGSNDRANQILRDIAKLGEGQSFQIEQRGEVETARSSPTPIASWFWRHPTTTRWQIAPKLCFGSGLDGVVPFGDVGVATRCSRRLGLPNARLNARQAGNRAVLNLTVARLCGQVPQRQPESNISHLFDLSILMVGTD